MCLLPGEGGIPACTEADPPGVKKHNLRNFVADGKDMHFKRIRNGLKGHIRALIQKQVFINFL